VKVGRSAQPSEGLGTSAQRTQDNPHTCLMPSRTNLGSFWSQRSVAGRTKWPVGLMLVGSRF
jgi:hypothetical protein